MGNGLLIEGIIGVGGIVLLLYRGGSGERRWLLLVSIISLVLLIAVDKGVGDIVVVEDTLTREMRVLIIILVLWGIQQQRGREGWVIIMVGLGGIVIVGAGNILLLYMAIELQAISIYILLGQGRKRVEGLEGAIKYYIIGGLATGLMAYGWSLQYKSTGEISISGENILIGGGLGKILVTIGLLVKVAAVPVHMWAPDVYEGASILVVGLLSTIGKISIIGAIIHIGPVSNVVVVSGILSLLYGGLGAINQTKLKRLLAYSGIVHMGYILLGLSIGSYEGMQGVIVYIVIYIVTLVGIITLLRGRGKESIRDYIGMSIENKLLAITLGVLLLSLAGMPPLMGFISKWLVIAAVIAAGNWLMGIIGGVIIIVNIVYYARLLHIQYFSIRGWEWMVIQRVVEGIKSIGYKEGYWIGGAVYIGVMGIWLPSIWLYIGNMGAIGLYK